MRSIRAVECAAATVILWVSACSEPYPHPRHRGAGASAPQEGGTLHLATWQDLSALDPASIQGGDTSSIATLLFDTLVEYAPGTFDVRPALAERWELIDGGRTLRFFLRNGVLFHDGTRVRASDVKASLERMIDPARSSSWAAGQFDRLLGYEDFTKHRTAQLAGIVVVDEHTVDIRLQSPDASTLQRFTLGPTAVVPAEMVARVGREAFGLAPVGSGPYVLESWEHGTRVVLRKNPRYFREGVAHVERIVIDLSVPKPSIAMRLQRGDVDLAIGYWLGNHDLVWFREHAAWKGTLAVAPSSGTVFGLSMNTEIPPWNNRGLRRAVAFAIDRDALARTQQGTREPLYTLYPPGIPGYDPHAPWAQRFDLEAARREMAAAGYPDGLPEEQELWHLGKADSLVLIQADLARIGIRVRLHSAGLDYGALMHRGAAPLCYIRWDADFPDPLDFAEPLFHSRSIADEGSTNTAFYANPELDLLLDRARGEQDPERRLAMYGEAQRIIVEDAPRAFLSTQVRYDVVHPYVRDYHPGTIPAVDLRGLWLDEPRRSWSAP